MPCCIKHSYFLKVSGNKSSGIWIAIIPAYTQLGHSGPGSVGPQGQALNYVLSYSVKDFGKGLKHEVKPFPEQNK